jgi:hypothetical protein
VYEFGKAISLVLQKSIKYIFIDVECKNFEDLMSAIEIHKPIAVIYNYHP